LKNKISVIWLTRAAKLHYKMNLARSATL